MHPVNTPAYSDRIPPAWTGVAQEPGEPCLMMEVAVAPAARDLRRENEGRAGGGKRSFSLIY